MNVTELLSPVANEMPAVERTLANVAEVQYPLLGDLIRHVMSKGGKRLRPALVLLAGRSFDYNLTKLIPMASAMELLHTATLVHDDMIDNAVVRRGRSTINSVWNSGTAVLVGDYLFAKSADLVATTENVYVMTLFARTLMRICNGELRQLFTTFDWKQTREDYYEKIYGKTASMFATSTESGAILSNAPERVTKALHDYGYNLGMAFQIVDDILDYTGDSEEVGKPVASDLRQGTVTLPALLLMERSTGENPIKRLFESGRVEEEAGMTVDLIRETGVIDESFTIARGFCTSAIEALAELPHGEAKRSMMALADYVLERTY